jgi:hypothetical protein
MMNDPMDRRRFTRSALLMAGALGGGLRALAQKAKVHMALSVDLLAGTNLNDSRAAYRIWADQVFQKFSLCGFEMLPEVLFPSARLLQMIKTGQVECFGLSAPEMYKAAVDIDFETMAPEDYAASGLEYLLLVNANSEISGQKSGLRPTACR